MQLLVEHMRTGGGNPKHVTREQLMQDGVPLAAASSAAASSSSKKPCGAFFKFLNSENEKRKAAGVRLSKDGYREFVNVLTLRWASSGQAFRDKWLTDARAVWADKKVDEEFDDSDVNCRDRGVYRSIVTEMGSKREPVETEFFELAVRQMVGVDESDPTPGFSRYAPAIRDACTAGLFVADVGAIPDAKVFSYPITCGVAHPGCCATPHVIG